jgi:hypothetical protein
MPIPYPRPSEDDDQFISRCMSDDRMVTEYPDESQRYAICQTQIENNQAILNQLKDQQDEG